MTTSRQDAFALYAPGSPRSRLWRLTRPFLAYPFHPFSVRVCFYICRLRSWMRRDLVLFFQKEDAHKAESPWEPSSGRKRAEEALNWLFESRLWWLHVFFLVAACSLFTSFDFSSSEPGVPSQMMETAEWSQSCGVDAEFWNWIPSGKELTVALGIARALKILLYMRTHTHTCDAPVCSMPLYCISIIYNYTYIQVFCLWPYVCTVPLRLCKCKGLRIYIYIYI